MTKGLQGLLELLIAPQVVVLAQFLELGSQRLALHQQPLVAGGEVVEALFPTVQLLLHGLELAVQTVHLVS